MKQAVFRCDASAIIGSGHVMRCLTIADCLRDRGWDCTFACSEETLQTVPLLADSGYTLVPADFDFAEIDLLIVDHYGLDAGYERAARRWARMIAVLDDLADRSHDCDVLLDQTVGRQASDYAPYVPAHCQVLTGSAYALLRPQFSARRLAAQKKRLAAQGQIKTILISLGSTNVHSITQRVLQAFADFTVDPFNLEVVVGSQATGLAEIKASIAALNARGFHHARLHTNVADMAQMMLEADLAIGAGGTTSWERCCLGLPSILIELADNQKTVLRELEASGAIINLGYHGAFDAALLQQALTPLCNDPAVMQRLSEQSFNVCDGYGTQRFVAHLQKRVRLGAKPDIDLRAVTLDDAQLLLSWRNDPQTRASSLHSEGIDLATHLAWLEGSLKNPDRYLYIAEQSGNPIGTVRADWTGAAYELSWTLAPDFRGQGIGAPMVLSVVEHLGGPFTATVKPENKPSARIAETVGMVLEQKRDGLLYYVGQ